MPYVPFLEFYPDLGERETRTITIPPGSPLPLPRDEYALLELYCDEPGCDCRRVMLNVLSRHREKLEAVVAFGWESPAFYRRWFGRDEPETIEALRGPVLNPGSPATELALPLLDVIRESVLADQRYVERLKRHYARFRRAIGKRARRSGGRALASTPLERGSRKGGRVSRNAPCPCGSGLKYKRCCLPSERQG